MKFCLKSEKPASREKKMLKLQETKTPMKRQERRALPKRQKMYHRRPTQAVMIARRRATTRTLPRGLRIKGERLQKLLPRAEDSVDPRKPENISRPTC
ncbi:hypothetical protein L596_006446 [Steinernema carpocapsae]|uniref:Uncharacterized protein n=1 Tax=Steinernema carpocapsae TaxID=34508 RepID=A0A4U8V4E3_STECR|nr:hypothetical protein L596_006446 [Steinernema carpocapsae]